MLVVMVLGGFHFVDAATTAKHLSKVDFEHQAPIRALLSGVFITADQQGDMFRVDSSERVCKFCNAPDSLHHRHWVCSHTQQSRDMISQTDLQIIQQQPPCFWDRGWCVEPAIIRLFRHELCIIPDRTAEFHLPRSLPDEFDCFTDGAARDPQQPLTRITSWGWVLGDIQEGHFWPVAEGGTPGLWQTVVRAEIFAVLSVIRFVRQFPRKTRIWCDNQLVVDRLQQLLDNKLDCTYLLHDHDLWTQIERSIDGHRHLVSVRKVCSHQDVGNLSAAEEWIASGNIAADTAATNAFNVLPPSVRDLWAKASADIKVLHQAHHSMLQHMARVSFLSIQFGKQRLVDAAPEPYQQPPQVFLAECVCEAARKLTRSFQFEGSERVFQWLKQIEDVEAPVKQICFPELLIAFQQQTGLVGVESIYTTKHNHRQWRLRSHFDEYSFGEVHRSFSAFCCSIIKLAKPGWKITHGRSSSYRFQYWTGILVVAIQPEVHRQIESWFLTHCGSVPFKKAADLANLPFDSGTPQV